jgi:methylglutaconyl-CoA hydratase
MGVVRVEDGRGVRTITLNRPEKRNALMPELQELLADAFASAEAAGARVVLLQGEGQSFCAGLDLSVLREMNDRSEDEYHAEAARTARMFRAVYDCAVPTVAVVRGAAVAGGAGLASICDFTLAADDAKFGYTEVRVGFVPALVSAYLALQVGDKVARELLLSARIIDATEARRLGLVSEVVPAAALPGRAQELAAELMRNSPEGLRATKRLLRAQQAEWLDRALEVSREANAQSRLTADFREGVAAFLEKRKPSWHGE